MNPPTTSGAPCELAWVGDILAWVKTVSTRPPEGHFRTRDVAELTGVQPRTVSAYLARSQMPQPDGRDEYGPWWHPDTITRWERPNQPGTSRGNRNGPRGHRARGADLTSDQIARLGDPHDIAAWAGRVRQLLRDDERVTLAAVGRAYGLTASTISQRLRRNPARPDAEEGSQLVGDPVPNGAGLDTTDRPEGP